MTPVGRKRTAVGAIVLGTVMFVGGIAMSASPDETRRLRCDRGEARCVLEGGAEAQVIDLSSIERAQVSHARSSGYSLQLVTPKGTRILSKSTMSSDSRREYEAAAEQIDALVAGRVGTLDVQFTHRAGIVPGVVIVALGLGFVAFGLTKLRL